MWIELLFFMCTIQMYNQPCYGLNFIDLPGFGDDDRHQQLSSSDEQHSRTKKSHLVPEKSHQNNENNIEKEKKKTVDQEQKGHTVEKNNKESTLDKDNQTTKNYPPTVPGQPDYRRHWLVSSPPVARTPDSQIKEEKDENIKSKIGLLVQQTMHDTDIKMKSIQKLKEKYREEAPYRVGFILSLIKKSRDVLNELFNVAVKHRDEWKALEQLKIFELIVHTNVDTTNLVRQLVEIHIQNLNSTVRMVRHKKSSDDEVNKNKVVLI